MRADGHEYALDDGFARQNEQLRQMLEECHIEWEEVPPDEHGSFQNYGTIESASATALGAASASAPAGSIDGASHVPHAGSQVQASSAPG